MLRPREKSVLNSEGSILKKMNLSFIFISIFIFIFVLVNTASVSILFENTS